MTKKIYRSNNDKMISGVCSGIGEYFDIDATLVRLAFVILSFATGVGIIAYIVCAIVVPIRPHDYVYEESEESEVYDKDGNKIASDPESKQKKTKQILGIGLLIIGSMLLLDNIFWWFDKGVFWAIGVIIVGGFLLLKPSEK